MRFVTLVGGVCVVGFLAVGTVRFQQGRALEEVAARENQRLAPEVKRCRERLGQIHQAWSRYRAAHNGAEPPTVESLLPRYLPQAQLLLCPAAERWIADGGAVDQGAVQVGGRQYPETYGLAWLTADYPRQVRAAGEEAPLVICRSHRELMYRAVYRRAPPLGVFADPQRRQLIASVADTAVLAVRRDGQIVNMPADFD